MDEAGECYILSNQFYSIQEVLDDLHEITGKRRLKSVLPLWFAKLTAPLAEVWYKCFVNLRFIPPIPYIHWKATGIFHTKKPHKNWGIIRVP